MPKIKKTNLARGSKLSSQHIGANLDPISNLFSDTFLDKNNNASAPDVYNSILNPIVAFSHVNSESIPNCAVSMSSYQSQLNNLQTQIGRAHV